MEKLAHNIAETIAINLHYDDDKKAVIAYGLAAIFQMASIFVITSIIGLLCGFWMESMVVFLAVGFLRKSTGGAHSKTFQGCMIISIFSIALLSFLARYILDINNIREKLFVIIAVTVAYFFSFIMVYELAPVDSPEKPIVRKEKIALLRRKSFVTLGLYGCIALSLIFLSKNNPRFISISISFCFATLWQVFTLTKTGIHLIHKIDSKFIIHTKI